MIFNASRSPLITNFKPLCLFLESNREFFCCILGQSEKFFRIVHHFSAKEFDCRFQGDQNGCLKMFRKKYASILEKSFTILTFLIGLARRFGFI